MRVDALCLHLLSMQLQIVFLGAPGPLLDAVVRRHSTNTAADTCCFRGLAPIIPHKSDVLLVDQSGLPTLLMTGGPADLEGPGGQLNGYALHPLIIVEGCHVRRQLGSIWIGRGGWSMEDGAVGAGCARSATSRRRGGTLPPSAPARVRDCCC